MPLSCDLTYIGGPTALIQVGGIRLLTDPTFDPPGQRYSFGFGTGSTKTEGPAMAIDQLPPIDAVLLSHDQHDDNLDRRGRNVLSIAGKVLTTVAGARRLGGNAIGLRPWQSALLTGGNGDRITVTATPAQHGSLGVSVLAGPTVGFVLEWPGQGRGAVYISGDTVLFGGISKIARRFAISVAVIHFGGVRFSISGPARYTLNAADGVRAAQTLRARIVVPIHFEGWSHFRTPRSAIESAFATAGKSDLLRWPVRGQAVSLEV